MHIAFLTPEYPHYRTGSSGGLGTSIYQLAHGLFRQGITVSIFVYGQIEDEVFFDVQIKVIRIKNLKFKGISWWLTRKKIQKVVNQYILKENLQILEVADWTGISAWIKIKCLTIMRLHGSDSYFCYLDKRKVKKWNYLQEKIAYKKAEKIIAVSDFVGSKSKIVFKHEKDYQVIPNGIDINYFKLIPDNQTVENTILYFGTLIRKKGSLDIPEIFNLVNEQNSNAKLIIVGSDASDILSGSNSTWSLMKEQFTPAAFKQVNYIGKIPYSQIPEIIKTARVCIFPSYAEALPLSWLEAMGMGKAIVASDIGWAKEMLEDSVEGYLVHPKNYILYSNRILELLGNSKLRKKFGEKARLKVENSFSTEKIVQKNIKFYQECYLNQ